MLRDSISELEYIEAEDIDTLLLLYSSVGSTESLDGDSTYQRVSLERLVKKNLVSVSVDHGVSEPFLTESGKTASKNLLYQRIEQQTPLFRERIQVLPRRGLSVLVNRALRQSGGSVDEGGFDVSSNSFVLDQSLVYERILLQDSRMQQYFCGLFMILESIGLAFSSGGRWWCAPEVESFLQEEFNGNPELSLAEEACLKLYFFFYVYAQDQRRMINFSDAGEQYRSLFFGSHLSPWKDWVMVHRLDPHSLLGNLELDRGQVLQILDQMLEKGIVSERRYPMSSFSFLRDDGHVFLIEDIAGFMRFIRGEFLYPVVDAIVEDFSL